MTNIVHVLDMQEKTSAAAQQCCEAEAPPRSHIYSDELHLTNNKNLPRISVSTREGTPLEAVAKRCYPICSGVQILTVARLYLTASLPL